MRNKITSITTNGSSGFNTFTWNLVVEKKEDGFTFLQKGNYTLEFKNGATSHEVEFEVK